MYWLEQFLDRLEDKFNLKVPFWMFRLPSKYRYIKYSIINWLERPNRIEPRTLGTNYIDKVELLPHVLFELLQQFVEKEKLDSIEWSCHPIYINGNVWNPREVWEYLLKWWKHYLIREKLIYSSWYKFYSEHSTCTTKPCENPKLVSWELEWDSEENEKIAAKLFKRASNKEIALQKELQDNLKLLIDTRPYMWT